LALALWAAEERRLFAKADHSVKIGTNLSNVNENVAPNISAYLL
jgi:hypothetical protein